MRASVPAGLALAVALCACPSRSPPPAPPPSPPSAQARDLAVTSKPAGARVLVDGTPACTTPCTVKVEPGPHRISVKQTGYLPWSTDVEGGAGEARVDAELVASH
jgi:hypothetical protein